MAFGTATNQQELDRMGGSRYISQIQGSARMSGLEFTEDAARQLERLYLTSDVVAQRSETIKLLALRRGERVLDVGCGPGFLCEDIAEVVGRDGAVTGIDISGDLIALCKRRNPPTWLSYFVGDAANIVSPMLPSMLLPALRLPSTSPTWIALCPRHSAY